MRLTFTRVAFLAGLLLTVQIGLNSILGRAVGNFRFGVLMNFVVGSRGISLLRGYRWRPAERPASPRCRRGPGSAVFWARFYVAVATLVGSADRRGGAACADRLGQLIASLLVDQFGWLGFRMQPISPTRLAGVALLLGGVGLITR